MDDAVANSSRSLSRLLPGGKGVWVPMDHGISGYPENGLDKIDSVIDSLIESDVDAIVLQKGVLTHQFRRTSWDGFVCHLSVSTVHGGLNSQSKVLVGGVQEAISRGSVAVSGQINLGDQSESSMIKDLGLITSDAWKIGVPTLGMVYPRGPNLIIDPNDITNGVAHAARVAFEIGCDVVKVPWTGSIESFQLVTAAVPIPVLIAGGVSQNFEQTLTIIQDSIIAGGSGVCMGRQIFGSESPSNRVRAVRSIVHNGANAEEALSFL